MWWIALIQAGMQIAGNIIGANGAASAADANAKQLEGQAADAYAQGAFQAGKLRSQASQMEGAQRAGYAGSGVDVTQGTPLETMAGTQFLSALDVQTAHNNAARRAMGFEVQAQQFHEQADWNRGWGMFFGATNAALSGAGQALSLYGDEQARKKAPNIADDAYGGSAPRNRIPNPGGLY